MDFTTFTLARLGGAACRLLKVFDTSTLEVAFSFWVFQFVDDL